MKRLFCLFVVVLVSTTAGVFLGLFMAAKFIDGQITVVKSTKMENVPMSAFVELQEAEFAAAEKGFTAVKHQREVGTGYFDAVTQTIEREASTTALKGSTEDEQFFEEKAEAKKVA